MARFLAVLIVLFGCGSESKKVELVYSEDTFGFDYSFIKQKQPDVVLLNFDSSYVLVSPNYQGRVLTSTNSGMNGPSFGWINYSLIESGKLQEHINVFGGEDRFWMGPEGGQFSLFFQQGVDFTVENWFTPPSMDTETFEVIESNTKSVSLKKNFNLPNYSGSQFSILLNRKIMILSNEEVERELEINLSGLKIVGFISENIITNENNFEWNRETGMPSIWILGMFKPSEKTLVFAPYSLPEDGQKIVTDDYFGKVSQDRLKVSDRMVLFKADGKKRSKIGLRYGVATNMICSYSSDLNQLTIVKYSLPDDKEDYVNSLWKIQENPFEGDVNNSYNDGPMDNGDILGGFYELESSSPAANLKPNETLKHKHLTIHLQGSRDKLNRITNALFNIPLDSITLK